MPTTHGKQHLLSITECFLETIIIIWKITHPWWNSNLRSPNYMPIIHMCINAYTDFYVYSDITTNIFANIPENCTGIQGRPQKL